jgi:hypothetical protein
MNSSLEPSFEPATLLAELVNAAANREALPSLTRNSLPYLGGDVRSQEQLAGMR